MPPKTPRTPMKKSEEDIRQEELEGLVHIREQKVERITRMKEAITSVPRGGRTAATVRGNQKKLELVNSEFDSVHQRIILLADASSRGQHDATQRKFEAIYDELIMTLEQWTDDLTPAVAAGTSNALAPAGAQPVVINQP